MIRRDDSIGQQGSAARVVVMALVGLCLASAMLQGQVQEQPAPGLVSSTQMPGALQGVGIEQKLGGQVPLDTVFTDENGRETALGDLLGERPAILTFVYYECPMLCPMILSALVTNLRIVPFDVGKEFDVIVVSFDPGEGPEQSAPVRETVLKSYERPDTDAGWHFLTGDEDSIRRLTEAAGVSYAYVPEDDEYAHASGIVIVTPEGKISQYYLGVDFPARDIRLSLVEASSNRIGSVVDQMLLYCYRFNPQLGKYTAVTMRILRLTGAVFTLGLATFLWIMWRRERAQSPA